jgi:thiosulfate/3-mercaptopyruvate sulfurtransferase
MTRTTLAAVLLLALAGCRTAAVAPVDLVPPVGRESRARMLVGTEELARGLGAGGLVVVQVGKEPKSYDAGHIPGALFLSYGALAVERDGVPAMFPPREGILDLVRALGVREADRVVFYDDEIGGFAARGWMAMEVLGRGGQAALLDGHLARWKAEGRPLSTEVPVPVPVPSDLVPVPDPLAVVDQAEVKRFVEEKRRDPSFPVALVDARPPEEFRGEKAAEFVSRPGRIPGSVNLPMSALVASKEDPVLKGPEDLRALFEGAGAGAGGEVIASCRTGRQASLTYFAAKYLGLRVRLYDGSFAQWQADPANEVAR